MSYERDLQAAQPKLYNVHGANDERVRYERMSPEERAEHDAKMKARNDADNARIIAAQQAKRDALEAARLADDAQRRATRETEARNRARALWAGDDASFDRQWPAMYEQMLAQQTTEQMQRASKAQRDFMVSRF